MRGVLTSGAVLVGMAAALGCGGRTGLGTGGDSTTPISFPVGTFEHCAEGIYTDDGNTFLRSMGIAPEGSLTVIQVGDALTATYVDVNGRPSTQSFVVATDAAATLAPAGQTSGTFTGLCVQGIGFNHEIPFPATLHADVGTLTFDHGAMIMTLHGDLTGDGGPCGIQSTVATRWVVCDQGPPVTPRTDVATSFTSTGDFTCASQVVSDFSADGKRQIAASGGTGTLSVKNAGDRIVADYGGDATLRAALRFTPATGTIGNLDTATGAEARCEVPISITGGNQASGAFDLASASIAREGSTLVVVFAGPMDGASPCAGARKSGALICHAP